MKKILTSLFIIFGLFTLQVFAASEKDITFPVTELGGCGTKAECRAFCEKVENKRGVCFEFAKKYNLLTQEEIANTEKFSQAATRDGGPAWCKQSAGCDIATYCEEGSHISECLDFAQNNNFISAKELEQARKVESVLKRGANLPGGCSGKDDCLNYCADLSHADECLKVGQELGVLTPKEAEDTRRFISLANSGQTPGGGKSKEECLTYCKDPNNLEECLAFAQKAGFLTSQEIETIRKSGGSGPGGCRSKGECEAFCSDPSNQNACLQFAKERGINVSFSGPGGCSDIESCTAYCTSHQDDATCKQYAGQYGGFQGPGGCKDIASCTEYCTKNQSDPECAKYGNQYGGQSGSPAGGFKGPGGCTDVNSCTSYCTANQSDPECQKYAEQYGGN